jgi:hypothetical protein
MPPISDSVVKVCIHILGEQRERTDLLRGVTLAAGRSLLALGFEEVVDTNDYCNKSIIIKDDSTHDGGRGY